MTPAHRSAPHILVSVVVVQSSGCDVPHAPPPQSGGCIAIVPVHVPVPHGSVDSSHWSRSVPLHVRPQTSPPPAHAVREPTGAPVTAEHVPAEPSMLQASHCCEHASLQHTPSTQAPLLQSPAAAHVSPFSLPFGLPPSTFGAGTEPQPTHNTSIKTNERMCSRVTWIALAPQTLCASGKSQCG
jgi:hypothetical protein